MNVLRITSSKDRESFELFFSVASSIYHDNPIWVPESKDRLISEFKEMETDSKTHVCGFVVLEKNLPVARALALYKLGVTDLNNSPQGWISHFEMVKGYKSAGKAVLNACETELKLKGVHSILAPKYDNQLQGLLIQGFNLPQTINTNYHPKYYKRFFKRYGFKIHSRSYCFFFTEKTAHKLTNINPAFHTRTFDKSNIEREIGIFHQLSAVFNSHEGYVPRSLIEDRRLVHSYLPFLDEDLVVIAESKSKEAVGMAVCLPDIYQQQKGEPIDRARLMIIAVHPEYRRRGVATSMVVHLKNNLLKKGYKLLEASWISEKNLPPQFLARKFKGKAGRVFGLYHKTLT